MKEFGLIKDIDINDESSWKDKIFITLDIDWASDEVIESVADSFISRNVKATWFVTHKSKYLDKLRDSPLFELGTHPNFNQLLNGSVELGINSEEILKKIHNIVPDATCIRSHSLTQNSGLVGQFRDFGYTKELNVLIPIQSKIIVKPYMHLTGIVELPHVWEDDVHMLMGGEYYTALKLINSYSGLTILDFHPIHLFLNETSVKHYESVKEHLNNYSMLKTKVNLTKFGTMDFLNELISSNQQSRQ
jgi:hypothetical protein